MLGLVGCGPSGLAAKRAELAKSEAAVHKARPDLVLSVKYDEVDVANAKRVLKILANLDNKISPRIDGVVLSTIIYIAPASKDAFSDDKEALVLDVTMSDAQIIEALAMGGRTELVVEMDKIRKYVARQAEDVFIPMKVNPHYITFDDAKRVADFIARPTTKINPRIKTIRISHYYHYDDKSGVLNVHAALTDAEVEDALQNAPAVFGY